MQGSPRRNSGAGIGAGFIAISLLFILGPILLPAVLRGIQLSGTSQLMLIGFGVLLLVIGTIFTVISRFYYRTSADMAFVRTGMGGEKPIISGGALVIPLFHDVIWVSLKTMMLEVERSGPDALITADFLRADIKALFYVKIPKNPEAVVNAATSLGTGAADPQQVSALLREKFESALRQVAAVMEITELLANRADFIERVTTNVKNDIAANGMELETVTISKLDQTRVDALRAEGNVFDAQGARKIAQIITEQTVARNEIELAGKQQIEKRKVEADTFLAEQAIAAARVKAEQETNVAIIQATQKRTAAEKAAEQTRLAGIAEIERDRELQLARTRMEQALALAEQARAQATQEAAVQAQQAVEVATRNQQIAIAQAEQLRAEAVALQLAAEVKRTEQEQAVTTAEVTATAERDKQQQLIGAQALVGKRELEENMKATVAAFALVTQAEAELKAAENKAKALLQQAEAAQAARQLEAKGELAVQSVPVEVDRAKVDVERERVAVQTALLESQSQHSRISHDLQIALAEIEARKQALIAQYSAIGQALGAANMTIWGDPSTLSQMMTAFNSGQANGHMLHGLVDTMPIEVKDVANRLIDAMVAAAPQFFGRAITREQATAFVQSAMTPDRPNTFGNVALTNED